MIWDNFSIFRTICAIACGTRAYMLRGFVRMSRGSLRSKRSCAFLARGKPRNLSRSASARVLAARKIGRAQKMKRGGGGKEGRDACIQPLWIWNTPFASQQSLWLVQNWTDDWNPTLAWLLTISWWRVTKKIYRELSTSWPRRVQFDRELKEEQECAILQLMRGGDLLGFPFAKNAQERLLRRLVAREKWRP